MNLGVAAHRNVLELSQTAVAETYAPLVKRIAYHMIARLPASVQVDDLIQTGMIGLLEAAKKYNAVHGASFETFASIRIRGAMLDEIRRNNWVPRSTFQSAKKIAEAKQTLENRHGRAPTAKEIALQLGVTIEAYHQMRGDCSRAQVPGLDDLGIDETRFTSSLNLDVDSPLEKVTEVKMKANLALAIQQLPEREQILLSLYYHEDLNLKEIGLIFNVSESRVCQIHAQAIRRLNQQVAQWVHPVAEEAENG